MKFYEIGQGFMRFAAGLVLLVAAGACGSGGSGDGGTPPATPPASVTLTIAKAGAGTGTITSNPAGINCGATCTLTVSSGTVVTLTAAPTPSNTLADWGGTCPAGSATCAVTATANQTVTATFATSSANPTLGFTLAGTGTGAITCNGGACNASYPWGTSIRLSGVAQAGSIFAGWSGGGCTGTTDCTVLLWADTTVTATFNLLPVTAQLTVNHAGSGTGIVTSTPAGINCGATCSANYAGGTVVTLTATPSGGSTFAGWTGAGCTGTGTCVVTLNANTTVTATFNTVPPTVTFSLTTSGTGTGTVTCNGAACQPSYPSGTALTIVATPAATSLFSGWGGDCAASGTTATCNLTINANTTVSATFNLPTLSVVVAGAGSVTSSPAGISCGATCTASFNKNTSITLTATPLAGMTFSGWSGGGCAGTGTCVVTLGQNVTVTATFGARSGSAVLVSAAGDQNRDAQIIADGSGGAIIVWKTGANSKSLYAQRLNAAGLPQWGANGILVCCTVSSDNFTDIKVVSDGASGAIIVWTDWRRYPQFTDVFAQRVNNAGVLQWNTNGIPVGVSDDVEDFPQIVSDGAGGAVIVWDRHAAGGEWSLYAQRVNQTGAFQWAASGIGITTTVRVGPTHAQLTTDGSNGVIVAWEESTFKDSRIRAQRVSAAGSMKWVTGGVLLTDYPRVVGGKYTGGGRAPKMVDDGTGGAIIVWGGYGDGSGVRGQRLSANGDVQWVSNGVTINVLHDQFSDLRLVSDRANGAILVWSDARNGSDSDIYAQRVTDDGAISWTAGGVVIYVGIGKQELPHIISDGAGGMIVVWQDSRSISEYDIYAQRLNADGSAQWAPNGLAISTALYDQTLPVITGDGAGGAWMAWEDERNESTNGECPSCSVGLDIYAQRVTNAGGLP